MTAVTWDLVTIFFCLGIILGIAVGHHTKD